MDINTTLLELLQKRTNHYMAFELYQGLVSKWPQINPSTKIQLFEYREISIALVETIAWPPLRSWQNASGIKARIWRALGELLDNRTLRQRGKKYDLVPTVPAPHRIDTVVMKRYGVTSNLGDSAWIGCAYYPRTDTLYIQDNTLVAHRMTAPDGAESDTDHD